MRISSVSVPVPRAATVTLRGTAVLAVVLIRRAQSPAMMGALILLCGSGLLALVCLEQHYVVDEVAGAALSLACWVGVSRYRAARLEYLAGSHARAAPLIRRDPRP